MDKFDPSNLAAIVLAGGKGTRMQTTLPKVLHHIVDKPMIFYTLENINKLGLNQIYVVVGHQSEKVKEKICSKFNCEFALQEKPIGTADAVRTGLENVDENVEEIIVMNGDDSAFYKVSTLKNFLASHIGSKCPVSMMTINIKRERRLGRIIRDIKGNFESIIEAEKDPSKGITSDEINCGLYVFSNEWLKANINKIKLSDKGEYYLTDIFNLAKKKGDCINLFQLKNKDEWVGVNTPDELMLANEKMKKKLIKK
ncbi:MAG: sugar phosphate nucleotidyltransferase [Microgenomates group bacterium]|jgi:bifunctional N-acetylglucosamine-1-phosphate-uridyltransferase/glucosamine-1-phosphate-acetyltransferase GlmU-like protein